MGFVNARRWLLHSFVTLNFRSLFFFSLFLFFMIRAELKLGMKKNWTMCAARCIMENVGHFFYLSTRDGWVKRSSMVVGQLHTTVCVLVAWFWEKKKDYVSICVYSVYFLIASNRINYTLRNTRTQPATVTSATIKPVHPSAQFIKNDFNPPH